MLKLFPLSATATVSRIVQLILDLVIVKIDNRDAHAPHFIHES